MMDLYEFKNVINIEAAKTRLYCKSTDCDFIYGQDEGKRRLKYNLITTELSLADPKEYGFCGPNYNFNGEYVGRTNNAGYEIDVEGLKDSDWECLSEDITIFLLALANPRVGGDECMKMFNLYGWHSDIKVKKSYLGSLYLSDKEGKRVYYCSELIASLRKQTE